jgi:hypothetical protein
LKWFPFWFFFVFFVHPKKEERNNASTGKAAQKTGPPRPVSGQRNFINKFPPKTCPREKHFKSFEFFGAFFFGSLWPGRVGESRIAI